MKATLIAVTTATVLLTASNVFADNQPVRSCPIELPKPTCPTCDFKFCVEVPWNKPHGIPDGTGEDGQLNRFTLVVDAEVPHWGVISGFGIQVYRNGHEANDIKIATFGVSKTSDAEKVKLNMQFWDRSVRSVKENAYIVEGEFSFNEIK